MPNDSRIAAIPAGAGPGGRREIPRPSRIRRACPADIGILLDLSGETRSISKGANVGLHRRDPEFAVFVLSGLLSRNVKLHNGSRQIVAFYFPGEWASVEALVGAPIEGEIAAVTRSKVRLIPAAAGCELLGKTIRIFRSLAIETLFQAGVQAAWLTRNSMMPAVGSLAHFLCESSARERPAPKAPHAVRSRSRRQ